jgi:hypothetical protein
MEGMEEFEEKYTRHKGKPYEMHCWECPVAVPPTECHFCEEKHVEKALNLHHWQHVLEREANEIKKEQQAAENND